MLQADDWHKACFQASSEMCLLSSASRTVLPYLPCGSRLIKVSLTPVRMKACFQALQRTKQTSQKIKASQTIRINGHILSFQTLGFSDTRQFFCNWYVYTHSSLELNYAKYYTLVLGDFPSICLASIFNIRVQLRLRLKPSLLLVLLLLELGYIIKAIY